MNTTSIDNAIKALNALRTIAEVLENPELCAEAMVAEIGEIVNGFAD